MTLPDPLKRTAREIVTLSRTCPHREAVASVEASLRLIDHEGFMRGERIGRCEARVDAIVEQYSKRDEAA